MANLSSLSHICDPPTTPQQLFTDIIGQVTDTFIPMNIATIDSEYGVLDRTVEYRGIKEGAIVFVTERNTRKYANIKANPKIAMTMLLTNLPNSKGEVENWQIRLIDAEAIELKDCDLDKLWEEEPLFAKIRSYICECGTVSDTAALQHAHDELLMAYQSGQHKLERKSEYVAFKMPAKRWDFYKSELNTIADRVQYRLVNGAWNIVHVDA